ncbi:protein hinderin isoform X2 [Electrophorus electricus]|uniref:protein hinderin isoform X2 n=1 Tax=Electrophorus electricus TaxID=8005 RepID=UPI0015D07F41|nr:protein hinderin isoform X2 [Electrophorus electricus]
MAAVAEVRNSEIYWIDDNDEQPRVYVSGMSKKMGVKAASISSKDRKVKGKFSLNKEGKSGKKLDLFTSHVAVEPLFAESAVQKATDFSAKSKTLHQVSEPPQALPNRSQAKSKASLKDLCPEDKRRIASLIEELARVSEEKEESVQRLRDEQETFEKKIQQLEEQNRLIIQERESLQQQYRECQELLGLYQHYLSQQQEKLNQSIAQLTQSRSHSKMANSEQALSRPAGGGKASALDGSYLYLASSGTRGRREGISNTSFSVPSPCRGQHESGHDGCTSGACRCPGGGLSVSRPDRHSKREQLASDAVWPCGATVPRGSRHGLGLENGNKCRAELSETAPPLGREDWEEKRQRLLLQKKQLEVEREKLQARLAQQEERLLKQNQELRQSRLDYHKFQHAATAELEQLFDGKKIDKNPHPCVSVDAHSEGKEGGRQALQRTVRQPLNDFQPQVSGGNVQPPGPILSHELSAVSKKDVATSPVHSCISQKSTPSQALPISDLKTPGAPRLDSSVTELLDVFSPIANPGRSRLSPSSQRRPAGPHQHLCVAQPIHRTLLSPPGQGQPSQQDLEESQMLEDIFFIC